METVTLARNAMNARFELVLHGGNEVSLQAAGEEALTEIERIEDRLSLFRTASEIAHVNALAAREPVRVSPEVFSLLEHAQKLSEETNGAFDITLAPLLRCWGLLGRSDGHLPSAEELASARSIVGMHLVELDRASFTVHFARPGVMLDLGAIGKGYAVEQAAEILREGGVKSALIHGGTSTICAIGTPPDSDHWMVAIEQPNSAAPHLNVAAFRQSAGNCFDNGGALRSCRYEILLRDESLSVSAISGKCFVANGRVLGHVIDPRTGEPVIGNLLAAVGLTSATETDALSTALLVNGLTGHNAIKSLRPAMRTLVVAETEPGILQTTGSGIEPSTGQSVR